MSLFRREVPNRSTSSFDSNFTPAAARFIREAARQNEVKPDEIVESASYAVMRQVDGSLRSPDAGRFKVVIPGDLDLVSKRLSTEDFPAFVSVEGSVRVPIDMLTDEKLKSSLDIGNDIILVSSRALSESEKSAAIDRIEAASHVSYGGEIKVEAGRVREIGRVREADGVRETAEHHESKQAYINRLARMTREEFSQYLIDHTKEYGDMTNNDGFRNNHPSFIYAELVLRPEYRGISWAEMVEESKLDQKDYDLYNQTMDNVSLNWGSNTKPGITFSVGTSGFAHWKIRDKGSIDGKRRKAYLTLSDPIHDLTPQIISKVIEAIDAAGFEGQFKMTTDPKEASQRFDNMVIHGNDEDMVNVALMAAMKVLALNKVEIDGYDEGFDEDGKSHTEILANRVKAAVRERRKAAREAKG